MYGVSTISVPDRLTVQRWARRSCNEIYPRMQQQCAVRSRSGEGDTWSTHSVSAFSFSPSLSFRSLSVLFSCLAYIFLLFSLILSFCHSRRTYPPALYLPLHFFASFLVFLTSKQFIYYTLSFFLLSFLLLSTTIIFNPSVLYKGNLISVFYGNLTFYYLNRPFFF